MARVLLATDDGKLAEELKVLLEDFGHAFAGVVPADGNLLESALSRAAEVLLYDATGENGSRPIVIPGVPVLILQDEEGPTDPDHPNPYRLVKPLDRLELKYKLECAAYNVADTTMTPPSLSRDGEADLPDDWFRSLYEYAPDAYYIMDLSGIFVDGNLAAEEITGYKREELVGRNFIKAKLIPVGQIPMAVRLYQQNKKGKSTGPDEFVFRRKSGKQVPIEIRTYPILTGGRHLVLGIARDISKRKQAEEGLLASEARFRSMFELSPESLTLLDRTGRVITTNSKVYEWLGFKPEEIIGKRLSSLPILTKTGLLKVLQQFRKRIKGLDVPPYEAEFHHKDGGKIFGRISANPIQDEKGEISSVLVLISDVTAERRAKEELRASRDLLDRILNGMYDSVAVIGPDYRIREVNDSFLRTYGGSREKAIGKTCHKVTLGQDEPCPESCHLEKVFKTGKPKTFEHMHRNARGRKRSIEISLFPLQNAEGKVEGVVEMEHDVTLQKKVEKALREERDRAQTYLDIAGTIILALDAQGTVTLINQKGCEVLGYPEAEIVGKNWIENFIPDWTQERANYTFNRLLAGEVDPLRYVENYLMTSAGKMRLIAWNNTVLTDETGGIVGTLSSGEDITERRLAETALKESEEKFRNFFDNAPAYCYMVSSEGVILDVNGAALSTLGYEKGELVGAPLRRIYAPESHDKMKRLLTQWKETGTLQNEEMIIQTKGGDKRHVLLSATTILGRDGKPIHSISVQRDITDRRRAEIALRESEEKYRNLVERANDGIVIIQDKNFKYVNPRTAELLGYTKEEMLNTPFVDYIEDGERKKVFTTYRSRMGGENPPPVYETVMLHKEGRRVMMEVNAGLIMYGGKPADLVFLHDVTKSKEAEDALRDSEAKLKATLDSLPDLLFEVDHRGKIYDFRTPDASTLYVAPENFIGKTVDQVIPPEAARIIMDALAQAVEKGSHHGAVYVLNMPDGPHWLELSIAVRGDPKAPEGRLIVTSRDVTVRVNAEKALRLSEEQYRFLFEGSTTLNLIIGVDGTLLDSNISLLKEFGYTREEVRGRNAMEFVVEKDRELIAGLLDKSNRGEDTPEIDVGIIAKDGSVRTILFSRGNVVLTEHDQPVTIVVTGIDITERNKSVEQIKNALQEKEVLLKEIHHRVKNNLQIISSLLNLEAGKTQDEKVLDIISTSQNRIKSMALIHEKLYQSKELSRVDFPGYISSLLDSLLLTYTDDSRFVTPRLDLSPLYLDISTAIPLALIINELVSNSLEHAFPDERKGIISIGLKGAGNGDYTLLVADDGVGISDDLDLENTKTLGLQLVNMLTQQIGAVIEMDRGMQPNGRKGAEFRITFSEKTPQVAHEA
ncbi:MAG TPA: PAS domain S-box protein [bacterium]|nr:PAS domain S-box protein [bacterium]